MKLYSYNVTRVMLKNPVSDTAYSDEIRISEYAQGYVLGDNPVDARHKLELEFKSSEYNRYDITLKRTDIIKL